MKIGIDFDDVVADSIRAIIKIHNREYGTSFKQEDVFTYRVEEVWGGTKKEWRAKLDEFFSTKHLASLDPMAGSLLGIKALKELGHGLYIVTGRGKGDMLATEQWLKIHFPDVFKGVHYGDFIVAGDLDVSKMKKSDICKKEGITILIDDNPRIAEECATEGIQILLFDRPWNKGKFPLGVQRVHSWDEIVEKIKEGSV